MAILTINGAPVAAPKSLEVGINDLDGESTRNAKGELIRDRIAVKRKISAEWPPLTMAQASTLLQAVQNVFFDVIYPDPMVGGTTTKTFYVGDRSVPMLKATGGVYMWESIKMDFIEK
jgi:hypothetical protein